MEYEESFITIKLIWHSYLVLSLDNCVYETPTGLIYATHTIASFFWFLPRHFRQNGY